MEVITGKVTIIGVEVEKFPVAAPKVSVVEFMSCCLVTSS